jgi:hypothetical protein
MRGRWYKGDKYEKVRTIRNDTYVNLPLSEGITLPTALAAPAEEGIMLLLTLRPLRASPSAMDHQRSFG